MNTVAEDLRNNAHSYSIPSALWGRCLVENASVCRNLVIRTLFHQPLLAAFIRLTPENMQEFSAHVNWREPSDLFPQRPSLDNEPGYSFVQRISFVPLSSASQPTTDYYFFLFMSRHSSVGITTDYGLDGGFHIRKEREGGSFLTSVQAGCDAYAAPHPMDKAAEE
jgi:hypothetical protein